MGRQIVSPLQVVEAEAENMASEQAKIEKGFQPPTEGIVGLDTEELSPTQLLQQQRQRQLEEEEELSRNADLVLLSDPDEEEDSRTLRDSSLVLTERTRSVESGTSDISAAKKDKKQIAVKPIVRAPAGNSRKTKDMSNWNHWSALEIDKMPDQILKACCKGLMSFCFQSTTEKPKS